MDAERFPDDFLFGAALSSYQAEGGIDCDWTEWEEAGRLKEKDARCGLAVDHWNRFDEDVGLLKALGLGGFRTSLEWARLEPEPGRFDDAAAQAYRRRLEALVQAGLKPVVTLWHFTHPRWFWARCPWHEPAVLAHFERYAKFCAQLLSGLDVVVCTLNEPMAIVAAGYLGGVFPPGVSDPRKAVAATENLARAHVLARAAVKAVSPKTPVGIAQHLMYFVPERRWHPVDQALSRLADAAINHAVLGALSDGELRLQLPTLAQVKRTIEGGKGSMDYLGVNYYTRAHVRFLTKRPFLDYHFKDAHGRGLTDIGWEWYPEGFGFLLRACRRYGLPVWVLENGIDDRDGGRRARFIHEHLQELLRARAEGVDVRAYFHWSLLDNFEWLEAWGPRFGLYRVDRQTLARTATPACEYFKRVATSRILSPP